MFHVKRERVRGLKKLGGFLRVTLDTKWGECYYYL
jgi:uncharacterized membrane protein affecting hemolysin expression